MIGLTDPERVAIIGVVGALLLALVPGVGWLLKRVIYRSADQVLAQNTHEHLRNKEVLERIEGAVLDVSQKFTEHLAWHLDPHPVTTITVNTSPKEKAA